jgi:hypothetical protein
MITLDRSFIISISNQLTDQGSLKKMSISKYIPFIFLLVALTSCKEHFEPDLPILPQGYLVVEGFINAGGSTQIKLSRSIPIDEKQKFKPESNAILKIEGDNNTSISLSASSDGIYTGSTSSMNRSGKYRLRIRTSDGKEYLSGFVDVKTTPPIDSVGWLQGDNNVQVHVSTHDPQNKTIYYRWDFDETWEIRSAYVAAFKVDRVDPVTNFIFIREVNASDPPIYYCWKDNSSKNIVIGSSAKLEQDVIHQRPVLFIPRMDERLGVRYSIMVRQYALDKEGFQFYEQMQKNTESLGTIFDPQPSALRGNIECISNPGEIVIGYVSATTMEQKRMFIAASQLQGKGFNMYDLCETIEVKNNQDSLRMHPLAWPYEAIYGIGGGAIIAYKLSTRECVDCTSRGGLNVRPSFW